MKNLLKAARPKTLIASISPILIGTVMASSATHFSLWIFLFTLLTGVGIQIGTNFANDLFDFIKGADTPKRKGPVRVTANGLFTVAQMRLATFLILSLTALCGTVLIFRGGMIISLLVTLALLLAVGYTAGPFPLAYLGLAEIFILIFFGPVATGCTYYLQTLNWTLAPFIAGLSPGLISCSLLIVNNIRDMDEDNNVNKKTLVARFGKRFGKWEYTSCLIMALLIPLIYPFGPKGHIALAIGFIPAFSLIKQLFQNEDPYQYNPLLGKTGQLLTLYTAIFCLGYFV